MLGLPAAPARYACQVFRVDRSCHFLQLLRLLQASLARQLPTEVLSEQPDSLPVSAVYLCYGAYARFRQEFRVHGLVPAAGGS